MLEIPQVLKCKACSAIFMSRAEGKKACPACGYRGAPEVLEQNVLAPYKTSELKTRTVIRDGKIFLESIDCD